MSNISDFLVDDDNNYKPSLAELNELRSMYKATITLYEEPPKIATMLKENGMERYTKAVTKVWKNENWERMWWISKKKLSTEIAKQEDKLIEKAAFDVVQKFDEHIVKMVEQIDNTLPKLIDEINARMDFMNDRDLLTYLKYLDGVRKDFLDRVTSKTHVAKPNGEDATSENQNKLLNDLGLLAQITDTLRGKVSPDAVIDAEYVEEVEQTRKQIFEGFDNGE
jgi:hypothetical protein